MDTLEAPVDIDVPKSPLDRYSYARGKVALLVKAVVMQHSREPNTILTPHEELVIRGWVVENIREIRFMLSWQVGMCIEAGTLQLGDDMVDDAELMLLQLEIRLPESFSKSTPPCEEAMARALFVPPPEYIPTENA